MKNILLIFGLSLLLVNCSEDTLDTYHGNDGIYFAPSILGKYIDSTSFSFAMVTVDDTVVNMAVRLYGGGGYHDESGDCRFREGL